MKLRKIIVFIILVTSLQYIYGESVTLTIEKAVELALANNIEMQNARQDFFRAQAQRREAKATAYPVITTFAQQTHYPSLAAQPFDFPIPFGVLDENGIPVPITDDPTHQQTDIIPIEVNVSFGTDYQLVYGFNVTQPIFDGRVLAALRSANVYGDLAQASLDVSRLRVIEQTKITFYRVLLSEHVVDVMKSSLKLIEQNQRDTEALYKLGKAAEFDLIRVDVQVANQVSQISNARKTAALAEAGLKRVCGLKQRADISVVGDIAIQSSELPNYEELMVKLFQHQPLLTQLEANNKLMKENILLQKSEFMPSLALTGSYQQLLPYNRGNFDLGDFRKATSIGLSMNFPLFNGFGSVARVQQARADFKKSEYRLEDVKENLLVELSNLYLTLEEARNRIEAGIKSVKQANRGVEIAQELYSRGMTTQLQVMDANNARNQAELGLAQAYFEYHTAHASLARVAGMDNLE